ncbi:MAG: DUF362 domain-containing protein [Planctomycetota bacterium]
MRPWLGARHAPREKPANHHPEEAARENTREGPRWARWGRAWTTTFTLLSGLFALLWLLLRSGSKPSRFVYPCQQAAFTTASLAFGAPLVAALIAARRKLASKLRTRGGMAVVVLAILTCAGAWYLLTRGDVYAGPRPDPPLDYRAQIYHVTNCPQDPVGDHFVGLDNLLALMGSQGLKLYQSLSRSLESGPGGIIASDDVVVVKINYQWPERGGTNTDLLRGLIRRLVDHPDTFQGEIVVCENAQFNPIDGFDRDANNAQDHSLSPHDVVTHFKDLGYTVSHYDWTVRRNTKVTEYDSGDLRDGYIVYDYDSEIQGRVSYPKFQTEYGTYISLKRGLWSPATSTYDRQHLKFINVPVLKSHHATYGATVAVKHYMGVVTGNLNTNSHTAIRYGILGALLGEIQLADLNIVDCIWINADPYDGPWTDYGSATRRDELVASLDPVAADIWSVKNILIPAFLSNGFLPPWPYPSADPDDPSSAFRTYLDNSMYQILSAGYEVTNDLAKIDAWSWDGTANPDCNGNGIPDAWDISGGDSTDRNVNGVPDECEMQPVARPGRFK